jgi:hypothetical protein
MVTGQQTRRVSDFPQEIVDKIYEAMGYYPPTQPSHRDPFIEDRQVKVMPANHILFEDERTPQLIIIPGHNWDLREASIGLLTTGNLQQVGYTHLRDAATATIYRKIDSTAPAYALFSWAPEDVEFFIYEF